MSKILVIDDEPGILEIVDTYLRAEGFEVLTALNGDNGLSLARTEKPNLIVLDIMLPGMNGLEVLTSLRQESKAYVILLTAKTDEVDKIVGLSMGADDYLTKPFSPRELVARVQAALRRVGYLQDNEKRKIEIGKLEIDLDGRKVVKRGMEIELTNTEFEILILLANHQGIVLSRDRILDHVWGNNFFGERRVVDVHVGHLRSKLNEPNLIETVRGVGYRLSDKGKK